MTSRVIFSVIKLIWIVLLYARLDLKLSSIFMTDYDMLVES